MKGRYQHYKGKYYELIDIVRHSETLEEMVLYKALYDNEFGRDSLWVRPKQMFFENIRINGQELPRFRKIEEST